MYEFIIIIIIIIIINVVEKFLLNWMIFSQRAR